MIRSGETTTALTPFPIAPGTLTAYSASEPKHWTKGFRNELLAPLPVRLACVKHIASVPSEPVSGGVRS